MRMSGFNENKEGRVQCNVTPLAEPTSDELHINDSQIMLQHLVFTVVDNFKYNFKSYNHETDTQTWRCSFKPSCKAYIAVNLEGEVTWASNDHDHAALTPEQIQNASPAEILLHKAMDKSVQYAATSPRNSMRDPSDTETAEEDTEEAESTLPKLGPAFSVAGRTDVTIMDNRPMSVAKPVAGHKSSPGKVGSGQPATTKNDPTTHSAEFVCEFSVFKSTQTMRDILAHALEQLTEPTDGPSTSSNPIHEPIPDTDKLEDEWHLQFIKRKPNQVEEEDEEIEVDVCEDDEQPIIDEQTPMVLEG